MTVSPTAAADVVTMGTVTLVMGWWFQPNPARAEAYLQRAVRPAPCRHCGRHCRFCRTPVQIYPVFQLKKRSEVVRNNIECSVGLSKGDAAAQLLLGPEDYDEPEHGDKSRFARLCVCIRVLSLSLSCGRKELKELKEQKRMK